MKNDLNYVAKVERAIKEKYGEETIKNPKSSWSPEKEKEYLKQKKMLICQTKEKPKQELCQDVILIGDSKEDQTRTCPVCNTYSFSRRDDVYMSKFEACFKCYIDHIEGREEKWFSGWRPKK